jgi:nucleoside recognition membrane protein YjiH
VTILKPVLVWIAVVILGVTAIWEFLKSLSEMHETYCRYREIRQNRTHTEPTPFHNQR